MIEVHTDFLSDSDSNQFIEYYKMGLENELERQNKKGAYKFNYVDILENYNDFSFFKKIELPTTPRYVRIQCINNTIDMNLDPHIHRWTWTVIIFLNDDFEGGELVLDNMTIKPKRNQMFIVPGTTPHYVKNVISGDRYSLVLFLDNKLRIKKNCL